MFKPNFTYVRHKFVEVGRNTKLITLVAVAKVIGSYWHNASYRDSVIGRLQRGQNIDRQSCPAANREHFDADGVSKYIFTRSRITFAFVETGINHRFE